ncbi:glycosyltransferase [Enterobacter ludwigii]
MNIVKSDLFPVVIMTRNEGEYLLRCVESIFSTVVLDVMIYIVDNNSDESQHIEALSWLEKKYPEKVNVKRNKSNNWIIGINETLKEIKCNHKSKYFFISDGDIDFSNVYTKNACWLSYLIETMDDNRVIGKLGFSLNWDYISTEPELKDIYAQEQSLYSDEKKINDLYIAQVDTTACILRWDWSIEGNSLFYPDHMRYLRPELYSCRTPKNINVEHLGWYKYKKNQLSIKHINEKVKCFTLLGATVKPEIVGQASWKIRIFHKLFSRLFLNFWIIRRYYMLYSYIWVKGRKAFDGQI